MSDKYSGTVTGDRPQFVGFIDGMDAERIWGWAWDSAKPSDVIDVDFLVDGKYIRSVSADQLGADLLAAGIGNGCHRWSCALADLANDDQLHEINVRFGGSSAELANGPKKYLRGVLDLLPDLQPQAVLASLYIRGSGIEIGACNNPLRVPSSAQVQYVDRMSTEELRTEYPEMKDFDLVPVSIVADGETLEQLDDASQDFIIANNFLEHCQDPIGTLKNFFRVVRPGGVLFLVIPDRRGNIDVDRSETPIAHLIDDHEKGPQISRWEHYVDWTRTILKIEDDDEAQRKARALLDDAYSIHFHVFTEFEVVELLSLMYRRYDIAFSIEHIANNHYHETVVVARKE
jgi:ubiquinone/menaquinone biosynthesis C-methylase UbiE